MERAVSTASKGERHRKKVSRDHIKPRWSTTDTERPSTGATARCNSGVASLSTTDPTASKGERHSRDHIKPRRSTTDTERPSTGATARCNSGVTCLSTSNPDTDSNTMVTILKPATKAETAKPILKSATTFLYRSKSSITCLKDVYTEAGETVQNVPYDNLPEKYPMMCYCSAGEREPTCRFTFRRNGHEGRVPTCNILLWGFPTFGWYALKFMKLAWQKKFYVDDYPQASLGIMSFGSVISVLVDAFSDPVTASQTDRMRTKWGRRRPFVVWSAYFVPIVFLLGWCPGITTPGLGASLWYCGFHILFKLADTLFMIPWESWGVELTPIYEEKSNIWQWKEILANLGALMGMAILPLSIFALFGQNCLDSPNDGCQTLPLLSLGLGAMFASSCGLLVYLGKEAIGKEQKPASLIKTRYNENDIVPTLLSTWLNKPFRIILITCAAKAVGQEVPIHVMPFLTTWVVGEKCLQSGWLFGILILVNMTCSLMGIPIWGLVTSKIGKYNAFLLLHVVSTVATLAFVTLRFDEGDCKATVYAGVLAGALGSTYGGAFLLTSLLADVIDYDEFLKGGIRREASYVMAMQFIPKFMSIPGEAVPLILLSYMSYMRPPGVEAKGCKGKTAPDDWCAELFKRDHASIYQSTLSTKVGFVCNLSKDACGIKQNSNVRDLLIICFSVVPAVFVFLGFVGLLFYPKKARKKEDQENIIFAISRAKMGESVEDPWRPGNVITYSSTPRRHAGILAYFTPHELRTLSEGIVQIEAGKLCKRLIIFELFLTINLCPGFYLIAAGYKDLGSDLGASISPFGAMWTGIVLVGLLFNGVRCQAASEMSSISVAREDVVRIYNDLCCYTGKPRLGTDKE